MSTSFVLPTLNPNTTQTNAYLTKLMADCAPLPLVDVVQLLSDAYDKLWALGFEPCAQFVERLPHFVKMHLTNDVQAKLNAPGGLLAGVGRKMKLAKLRLENHPYWMVGQRQELEERRQQLIKSAEQARQNGPESDSRPVIN